jgi:hypothetical protein
MWCFYLIFVLSHVYIHTHTNSDKDTSLEYMSDLLLSLVQGCYTFNRFSFYFSCFYRTLVGKPQEKKVLGRPRHR